MGREKSKSKKKLKENPVKYRRQSKDQRQKNRINKREENPDEYRCQSKDQRQKNRINKREENPDEYRCQSKDQRQKHRINRRDKMNKEGRLHEFKIATMHGPIFICVCCHQLMFKTNVQLYENSIASIEKGILEQCIPTEMAITNIVMKTNNTVLNSEALGDYYLCKTCIRHMSNGKMPPTS